MLSRRWEEAETLFARGLECSEAEREALLADIDPTLASEVRGLWKCHQGGTFLENGIRSALGETYAPGQRIADRFTLLERLGAGGMGEVFRARDETLGREVALKFLHPEFAGDAEWAARLEHEARIACALQHPNICTLFDLAWDGEIPFLVMEYLEGETLTARLERGPLPREETEQIAAQICAALRHAHGKGVVHRDLKPSNVLLTAVGVKILDFGIAKRLPLTGDAGATFTLGARVVGSAPYMSPEQAAGRDVDQRSDVFSFGCVLYEMLTGRRAFAGDSPWAAMAAVMSCEPAPVAQIAPDSPPYLAEVAAGCLQKELTKRYQSIAEVENALHKPRTRSLTSRWRWMVAAAALAVLAASVALGTRPFSRPLPAWNSVAVLPFTNETNEPEVEYLADGLSEALTNALSRLSSVRVIARSTALAYKGQAVDVQAAGRRLKVQALVTGRVSARAGRLRVQADLADTGTGAQLWGNKYEGGADELVMIEERLVRDVAERFRARTDRTGPSRPPTDKAEAYRLYLQGRQLLARGGIDEAKKSIALFQQVLGLDPLFASAYAGIAEAYWGLAGVHLSPDNAMPQAKAAAARALEIDPELPEGHLSFGVVEHAYNFAWKSAAEHFRRAIQSNPNYALAHLFLAWTHAVNGRFPEGIAAANLAFQLDPLSPFVETGLGQMYSFAGDNEAAIRRLRNVVEFHPSFPAGHLWLGAAYLYDSRLAEAARELEETSRLDPSQGAPLAYLACVRARQGDRLGAVREYGRVRDLAARKYITPYVMAVAAAAVGATDEVFQWLQKSLEIRDDTIAILHIDPVFRPYRQDPRYLALVRKLGFETTGRQ